MSKSSHDPVTPSDLGENNPSIAPKSPAPRLASIDAYRGLVMFLMMAEVLQLCRVAGKLPGQRIWELLVPSSVTRGMGRLLAARLDSAFVLVSGRRGAAVLAGEPAGEGPVESWDDRTRTLAFAHPGFPGRLSPVAPSRRKPTSPSRTPSARSGWDIRSCSCSRSSPHAFSGSRSASFLAGYWAAFAFYPAPGSGFDFDSGRRQAELVASSDRRSPHTGIRTVTWPGRSIPGS